MEHSVICFSSSKSDQFPSNTLSRFQNDIEHGNIFGKNMMVGISSVGLGGVFKEIKFTNQEPLLVADFISPAFTAKFPSVIDKESIKFDFSTVYTNPDDTGLGYRTFMYENFTESGTVIFSKRDHIVNSRKIFTIEEYLLGLKLDLLKCDVFKLNIS